ncbi:5-oxoprolinase subunit PxpA [Pseudaminobacter sp. 19-2017]|uniref:5-oxoprolinase subunit PxpA n=1 Tax=Pseudaminobacter soli (ex Zhang et al. 2022) TaxID=2831468 RepID=A0A942DZT2_9HYPH|nr:5-oxoprolinase subunit PxpA [Pseudaminobacter soli]MBS3650443.1 5-oxoprolinase subunit PxpA [Pseudaminobacter soli]
MRLSAVDLNCDMGEAFGRWTIADADDARIMALVSSANIAAGFHAGDPMLMNETVRLAAQHGVGVGAHPGYRDLQGFGRRKIAGSNEEILNDVIYQVGAVREFARCHGVNLQHVKPHGALYMEMAVNEDLSRGFIDFMRRTSPDAYVFCLESSLTCRIAREMGQPVVREFYADREYDRSGSIVFARRVGRLDPERTAEKVVRACHEGKVRTVDGDDIDVPFESICFHSDTPGCVEIGSAIRDALTANGIRIAPVSEIVASPAKSSRSAI